MIDNDRSRVSQHNFCQWKAVEVGYLQNFSAVFREAVHAPPELKLGLLYLCAMRMMFFSVPLKSIKIDCNCF